MLLLSLDLIIQETDSSLDSMEVAADDPLRAVPDLPGRSDREAAPRERPQDMPALPDGGDNNNSIMKSHGSHINPILSCRPNGSGGL